MAETGRFPNRTAWITGASSGIGRALSLHMARDGWQVAASARSRDGLDALAEEAAPLDGRILACPCDITDPDSVAAAWSAAGAALGTIDLAVLNAGLYKPVRPHGLKAEDFRHHVDLNLIGTVNCLEAVLPSMLQRGAGKIAVVSSVAGFRGLPTSAAYGMTKAGLINMCEAFRPELDRAGVAIQVICPGFVKTPATDRNDFEMPFLMEVDDAAQAFYTGLHKDRFEISFPWQMAWLMRLLKILPAGLAFAITKNFIPSDDQENAG